MLSYFDNLWYFNKKTPIDGRKFTGRLVRDKKFLADLPEGLNPPVATATRRYMARIYRQRCKYA